MFRPMCRHFILFFVFFSIFGYKLYIYQINTVTFSAIHKYYCYGTMCIFTNFHYYISLIVYSFIEFIHYFHTLIIDTIISITINVLLVHFSLYSSQAKTCLVCDITVIFMINKLDAMLINSKLVLIQNKIEEL